MSRSTQAAVVGPYHSPGSLSYRMPTCLTTPGDVGRKDKIREQTVESAVAQAVFRAEVRWSFNGPKA